jgi:hypothetical protein
MSGASISLPSSSTVEEVAAFLREKLMSVPAGSGNIHFAGVILSVLDVSDALSYTRTFMKERNLQEVDKYDAYVDAFDLTTMVTIDCAFGSLFYRHFLPIAEIVALELSRHFQGFALVELDGVNEQHALYEKGLQVRLYDSKESNQNGV